jgi:hypothetical protein
MIPFFRDLLERFREQHAGIERTIADLPPEALDWSPGEQMNSITVLVVHLTGAERFLIGDMLIRGREMNPPASTRDRAAEFRAAGWSALALIERLHENDSLLQEAFEILGLEELETPRKHPTSGKALSAGWAMLHALEHTAEHAGHIQMVRQMWQQQT